MNVQLMELQLYINKIAGCLGIMLLLPARRQYHHFNTITSALVSYKSIIYKSHNIPNQSIFLTMNFSRNTWSRSIYSNNQYLFYPITLLPHLEYKNLSSTIFTMKSNPWLTLLTNITMIWKPWMTTFLLCFKILQLNISRQTIMNNKSQSLKPNRSITINMKCLLSPLSIHILRIILREIPKTRFIHLINVLKKITMKWNP